MKSLAFASWIASAAAAAAGVWHVLHGIAAFREWRRWRTADPSLADFFLTELEIELAFTAVFLIATCLLAFAARQSRRHRRSDEHARPD